MLKGTTRVPFCAPGTVFGLYTVIAFSHVEKAGRVYLARCVCGTEKPVPVANLRRYALIDGGCKSCRPNRACSPDLKKPRFFSSHKPAIVRYCRICSEALPASKYFYCHPCTPNAEALGDDT